MYTPPTRRDKTVSSRRHRRCVLGIRNVEQRLTGIEENTGQEGASELSQCKHQSHGDRCHHQSSSPRPAQIPPTSFDIEVELSSSGTPPRTTSLPPPPTPRRLVAFRGLEQRGPALCDSLIATGISAGAAPGIKSAAAPADTEREGASNTGRSHGCVYVPESQLQSRLDAMALDAGCDGDWSRPGRAGSSGQKSI